MTVGHCRLNKPAYPHGQDVKVTGQCRSTQAKVSWVKILLSMGPDVESRMSETFTWLFLTVVLTVHYVTLKSKTHSINRILNYFFFPSAASGAQIGKQALLSSKLRNDVSFSVEQRYF